MASCPSSKRRRLRGKQKPCELVGTTGSSSCGHDHSSDPRCILQGYSVELPVLEISSTLQASLVRASSTVLASDSSGKTDTNGEADGSDYLRQLVSIELLQKVAGAELCGKLAVVRNELLHGGGAYILRCLHASSESMGMDQELDFYRCGMLALGVLLGGKPARQSADLKELVGDVLARPPELGDRLYRGYRNPNAQKLHTDSNRPGTFGDSKCEILMMLCIRPSASGGTNKLLMAETLHHILGTERPDLYEKLRSSCWPWVAEREWLPEWGLQEELAPGLPLLHGNIHTASSTPTKPSPTQYGVQYGKILRMNVEEGLRKRENLFGMREDQEALDVLEAVANRDELCSRLRLEKGDVLLLNNFAWMHGRDAFPEEEPDGKRRHMMRLWLQVKP